jgi:hypothetical protein
VVGIKQVIVDEITIRATPAILKTSGSWVEVTWSGVISPSTDDWVGVYAPSKANYTQKAPLKYQYAHVSPTYMKTGYGSLSFRMVNMRSDIGFVFFRHGIHHPIVASVSNSVIFENPNEPLQVHLGLTSNPKIMSVSWVCGAVSNPQVKWGISPGKYSSSSKATWSTYKASDLCGTPAIDLGWQEPGWIIVANITDLSPGVTYYYIVGDNKYGWSKEFSFSGPRLPDPSQMTRVVAYGDMGNGMVDGSLQHWEQQASLDTTRQIYKHINDTDVLFHIGDISYAVGYAGEWDEFFDQISPIASCIPYMVSIGNHERDYPGSDSYFDGKDSGGECGVPYERRFFMPRPSLDQPWYSVSYGNIHFILMSTEHDWSKGSDQAIFLEHQLLLVNRSQTPWLVFAGHRPMYVDSVENLYPSSDQVVASHLRRDIEYLLRLYEVDLAMWGHNHSYQRTCPVFNEKCVHSGTTHVVIGMGGHDLSNNMEFWKPSWAVVVDNKVNN